MLHYIDVQRLMHFIFTFYQCSIHLLSLFLSLSLHLSLLISIVTYSLLSFHWCVQNFFYFSHLVNRDTFVICNVGSGSQYRGTYSVVFVIHGTSSNLPEHFIHTHLSALLSCLTKYIGRFTFRNGLILHILPSLLSQHESKSIKMFLCRHKQRIINECT